MRFTAPAKTGGLHGPSGSAWPRLRPVGLLGGWVPHRMRQWRGLLVGLLLLACAPRLVLPFDLPDLGEPSHNPASPWWTVKMDPLLGMVCDFPRAWLLIPLRVDRHLDPRQSPFLSLDGTTVIDQRGSEVFVVFGLHCHG
jgi:hypothetical protein